MAALLRLGRDAEARGQLLAAPGGGQGGADPAITRLTGLLLAGSADAQVHDAGRGLELTRQVYDARPNQLNGQILAVALAATGHFENAAELQGQLVSALERAGPSPLVDAARHRLELYRGGQPATAPWRDDPALLGPVSLPLPPAGTDRPEP